MSKRTPPGGTANLYPYGANWITMPTGSYEVYIVPDAGNAMAWQKRYTLVGTGKDKSGHATRIVKVQVQQQSFALYSYFTDQEVSSISGGTIWFISQDRLYGPVHTNDQFHINWDTSATNPIFYGTVSSTNKTVSWQPSAPNTDAKWAKVLQGGQDALTTSTDNIVLPSASDLQKNKAWGNTSGFPSTAGVYVPHTGSAILPQPNDSGIYIVGDTTSVTFSLNGTVGQTVTVVYGSGSSYKRSVVNTNMSASTTQVLAYTGSSSSGPWTLQTTSNYTGLPNGVIYDTGNIASLSGVLADNVQSGGQITTRNAWTVCTDIANNKNVTITGDLKYKTSDDPNSSEFSAQNLTAACLGLVANNIIVDTGSGTSANQSIHIDGTLFASGSFYDNDWQLGHKGTTSNYQSGDTIPAITTSGGIIQAKRGPVGSFSGSSIVTGYSKNYSYDPRMADNPPPYFPTTGQFDVITWQSD